MTFFIEANNSIPKSALSLKGMLLLVSSISCCNIVNATEISLYENIENIRNTAKIFLEEMTISADMKEVELNIGGIDPRLKLKKCNQPLTAFLPAGSKPSGKLSIGVKCNGQVPWKIFISATKYHFQTVVIANNSLAKGKTISKQDLGYKRVKVSNFRKQPAMDKTQVVSTSPRRFIRSGSIIYMNSICMICKGSKVNVTAGSKYFSINLEAEALADASIGEQVMLRNTKSRRIFDGEVVGRNKAQVILLN